MRKKKRRNYDADLAVWPALSFWYGIGPGELFELPRVVINEYIEQLPRLRAEWVMMNIQASTFPHIKKGSQQTVLSDLKSDMKDDRFKDEVSAVKPLSIEDSNAIAQGMGFGFEIVEDKE